MFKFQKLAAMLFVLPMFLLALPHPVTAGKVVINMTASVVKKTDDGKLIGGWDPRKIAVNEGDEVEIHLKSADAEHVFSLEEYGIEEDVTPGHPANIHFVANKPGIFYYHCGMECGPLHRQMVGQLVVTKK